MTSAPFAGFIWLLLGAHTCARYYSDDPYTLIAAGTIASQAAMAVTSAVDAFGLTTADLVAILGIALAAYDIRHYLAQLARRAYQTGKK